MSNWKSRVIIGVLLAWGIGMPIWMGMSCAQKTLRIAFAEEQTAEFERLARYAISSRKGDGEDYLDVIEQYYPSGTKQIKGTPLDIIVERSRRQACELLKLSLEAAKKKDK